MDTRTVALRLVELTSTGQDAKALDELYADGIVSVEVMSDPEADAQVWGGIDAVSEKHAWWDGVATVHSVEVDGPFAGSGSGMFVVGFTMDVTMDGERNSMREVGVFTVDQGKIVKEVYLGLASQPQSES